jgi:hypothetical protein
MLSLYKFYNGSNDFDELIFHQSSSSLLPSSFLPRIVLFVFAYPRIPVVINYSGDLMEPPSVAREKKTGILGYAKTNKTIRGRNDDGSSDEDDWQSGFGEKDLNLKIYR